MFSGVLLVASPVILAGICNMVFMKLPILDCLKKPLDAGRCFFDGKRVFGDHKTWKGLVGMIIFSALFGILLQHLCRRSEMLAAISVVDYTCTNGFIFGTILGCGYILAELPNSFIKRRLDISPGKNGSGLAGGFFTFLDQADSVIGCLLALCLYYIPPFFEGILCVFVFSGLHYALNIALYLAGLRKQCG
jgi:CDP-diglyceride synthetase